MTHLQLTIPNCEETILLAVLYTTSEKLIEGLLFQYLLNHVVRMFHGRVRNGDF